MQNLKQQKVFFKKIRKLKKIANIESKVAQKSRKNLSYQCEEILSSSCVFFENYSIITRMSSSRVARVSSDKEVESKEL